MNASENRNDDKQKRKPFKASRLGMYIAVFGWVSFLVIVGQGFEWADVETVFFNFFSVDIKVLPYRAMALAVPLIFSIIAFMVFQREKFLGDVITTGRRLESKNLSLETSYKKLYGKMKEGVAGSAHTVLLEETRLMVRGADAVIGDMIEYRIRHLGEEAARVLKDDLLRFKSIVLLQEMLMRCTEPGKIDVRGYIVTICRELSSAFNMGKVKFDVDVRLKNMGVNTIFPLGLIVTELVMNSMKHAFAETEEPTLGIIIKNADKAEAVFMYTDNGCGIAEDLDISRLDTMGFKMVGRMARAMKGRVLREQGIHGMSLQVFFNPSGKVPA